MAQQERKRAIEVIQNQKECLLRKQNGCKQQCTNCTLVNTTQEVCKAYDIALELLQNAKGN